MQATIDSTRQDYDEKMNKIAEEPTEIIVSMMDQIKISKPSLVNKYSPKSQHPTTLVLAKKRSPPLEGGHSTKLMACGLSNMRSDHQNYMNYSSIHNSKATLLYISRTSTTTSRCVSMW